MVRPCSSSTDPGGGGHPTAGRGPPGIAPATRQLSAGMATSDDAPAVPASTGTGAGPCPGYASRGS
eukprot:gene31378-10415_t